MRLLLAAPEMTPFTGISPLAESLRSLAAELQSRGHSVSVVIPFHRCIRENKSVKARTTAISLSIAIGSARHSCDVLESATDEGVQVFFIRRDEYFDRSGMLGTEGRDYEDNAERFIYFTKAAVELARHLDPAPDILHAFGWQTALLPVFVRNQHLPFATALSIRDFSVQGNFWSYDFGLTNLPQELFSASGVEYYGSLNCLKGGILFADAVIVPGERFASDIQLPRFGNGMDAVLRENAHKLAGIPEGVDYRDWDPSRDESLPSRFTIRDPSRRAGNREALLRKWGLEPSPSGPVIAISEKLSDSIGWQLLAAAMDRLMECDVRLVIAPPAAGSAPAALAFAIKKHASRIVLLKETNPQESRLIMGGGDIFLLPGRFDPLATGLLRALRYGAVPVARNCGGLSQLVRDYEARGQTGNGFVFYRDTPEALLDIVRHATATFRQPEEWKILVRNAMESDFSWQQAAANHEALYQRIHRSF